MAQRNSTTQVYRRVSQQASRINDVQAVLVLNLQSSCIDMAERATVLNAFDRLIRLKIDACLLREGRR